MPLGWGELKFISPHQILKFLYMFTEAWHKCRIFHGINEGKRLEKSFEREETYERYLLHSQGLLSAGMRVNLSSAHFVRSKFLRIFQSFYSLCDGDPEFSLLGCIRIRNIYYS